jgi:pyruvate/2-oxoglutarate dehydrogenase complex dihydrolipoamide dehydrogenase (E3) component
MAERFDAAVIGSGPADEVAVSRLVEQGLRVALCERELIGGDCAYWACIPSKTLLRPTEVRAEARRVAGVSEPGTDWPRVAKYRDFMIRDLDDTKQESGYRGRAHSRAQDPDPPGGPARYRRPVPHLQRGLPQGSTAS